jgi:hypothetical protein
MPRKQYDYLLTDLKCTEHHHPLTRKVLEKVDLRRRLRRACHFYCPPRYAGQRKVSGAGHQSKKRRMCGLCLSSGMFRLS